MARQSLNDETSGNTKEEFTIAEIYRVGPKIGSGNFGEVRLGKNLQTKEKVAVKMELIKPNGSQLEFEYRVYRALHLNKAYGFPGIFYYGHGFGHNFLVMQLLGSSLGELFNRCRKIFTYKTVLMIGIQLLERLQTLHDEGVIYRDIKPENFLVGLGTFSNTIFMVDLGLAKDYLDPLTKEHIPFRESRSLTGTARYMSINSHLRRELSRRDDMEALGYMLIYFLRGSLPWQGLTGANVAARYRKIGEKKQKVHLDSLCHGYPEMLNFIAYTRKLDFTEAPAYSYWQNLFSKTLKENGWENDSNFDWKACTTSSTNDSLKYDQLNEKPSKQIRTESSYFRCNCFARKKKKGEIGPSQYTASNINLSYKGSQENDQNKIIDKI